MIESTHSRHYRYCFCCLYLLISSSKFRNNLTMRITTSRPNELTKDHYVNTIDVSFLCPEFDTNALTDSFASLTQISRLSAHQNVGIFPYGIVSSLFPIITLGKLRSLNLQADYTSPKFIWEAA